jgi:general secretion pathway protein D
VHHNKEVTLKVQVEVSQVTGSVDAGSIVQPIIGTRQIQTVIRLRDGETNMLAGLIGRVEQDQKSGVVGISDIPGLRRVMGNSNLSSQENDIVMTLTPRIIRIPDITEDDLAMLWVGTEENMTLRGAARDQLSQGPFYRGEDYQDVDASLAALPPTGRTGGASTIAPSDEVVRERESAGAAPEPQDAFEEPPPEPDAGGAIPPPPEPEPDGADAEGEAEPAGDPAGPASVRVVPSRTSYSVGEQVVVDVAIENAANVGSVPFHLRYDPSVLQFLGPATEGSFMGADGTTTVFLATDVSGGGEIVVGLSRLQGPSGASGSGVLATFQFMAVGPGDAGFTFSGASVKNPQAGNQPASFSVTPVRVEP